MLRLTELFDIARFPHSVLLKFLLEFRPINFQKLLNGLFRLGVLSWALERLESGKVFLSGVLQVRDREFR